MPALPRKSNFMTLQEIANRLNGQLVGPADLEISGPAKIESAVEGQITFIANPKYLKYIATTKASAIVVDGNTPDVSIPHIKVANAYVGFLYLLKMYEPAAHYDFSGISDKAFISNDVLIGDGSRIAPFVFIGSGVSIGKNCVLFPGVVILENCNVGNDVVFYPNVSVRENCRIGNRTILNNGCVIGSDGFGFAPDNGRNLKIPQIGNVVLEDDVEIGANTTVDRATIGSTLIKKGVKLDNLVQVGHNCIIGEHTVIAGLTALAGSSELGDHCTVAGQVGIAGHIKVGSNVIVAGKSGVTKDTPAGSVVLGMPAMPIMKSKRIDVSLRHLPDMNKRIRKLEAELKALKETLKIKEDEE